MRDAVAMWRNTRLVVLAADERVAVRRAAHPVQGSAAHSRRRRAAPGQRQVPVVCSFLFGPAGAWGAAIGNLIGDFFGGIGPGDFFGFAANFSTASCRIRVWRMLSPTEDPLPRSCRSGRRSSSVVALCCGALCSRRRLGAEQPRLRDRLAVLASIVFFNNFLMAVVAVAAPAVGDLPARASAPDCATTTSLGTPPRRASVLLGRTRCRRTGAVGGFVVGNLISTGRIEIAALATNPPGTRAGQVGAGVCPVHRPDHRRPLLLL